MSANAVRWVAMVLLAAFVLGLLIWARGIAHHRGDDVASLGAACCSNDNLLANASQPEGYV